METAALVVGVLAGSAVIAVAVKLYLVAAAAQAALARATRLLEIEAAAAAREWGEAARGVQRAIGKLEQGVESLNRSLARADRATERLEPDTLAAAVIQPAVARVTAWLGGVRKGLSGIRSGRGDEVETEAG